MNIERVYKDGLCTGCGTCTGMCPVGAIEMVIDQKKGIYKPLIDKEKCTDCRLCYKICPGHSVDFKELNEFVFGKQPEDILLGNYVNCYTGYSTDYNIRYNSSSGGLVTQLLIFALEEGIIDGALVTRMKKDKPLEPEPFIARTKEEIIEAMGSKYCPVSANVALKEILNSKEGEKFAVVGLPCHIHGIRKAEQTNKKLKEKIVLHLSIMCNHTPKFIATEFLLNKKNIRKKDIIGIRYRGDGWPGQMKILLKRGKLLLLGESWDKGFGQYFFPMRCTLCCDHSCELADIALADAWGLSEDKIGTSLIVLRTDRVKELLEKCKSKNKIKLDQIDAKKVLKSQSAIQTKKDNLNARFSILKFFGKKVPTYDLKLSKSGYLAYLKNTIFYLELFLASKKYLWSLLNIYIMVKKYAFGAIGKMIRIIKK